MSIRDELARIINMPSEWPWGTKPRMKAIIDAILARYAVVELPEPDEDNGFDPPNWTEGGFIEAERGLVYIGEEIGSSRGTPATVRVLAAALLAAANRAEAQQ